MTQEFLDSGSAPAYFGFGSIICMTSKFMTLLCLRALRLTGERGILCRGWSAMCLDDLQGEVDGFKTRDGPKNLAWIGTVVSHSKSRKIRESISAGFCMSFLLCLAISARRKSRSETSDNMDRWKSSGKSQRREEKKREYHRRK